MAGIKDRLIQFILRGKDELSPEARKAADAIDDLSAVGDKLNATLDEAKNARGLVNQLGQTERELDRAKATAERTEKTLVDLREALAKNPDNAGLADSLKAGERAARASWKEFDKLTASHKQQEAAARAAGIDTANLANEERRLTGEVDRTKAALVENNQQLRALQREQAAASRAAAEHTSRIESARAAMSSGAKQVLAFAATYVSLNAAFNLIAKGVDLARQGITSFIDAGSDKQSALAQLEATLASTGNAAGLTAQQLLDMADKLEGSSMLTSEQIQSAQTRLLSYTDVVGKEFPRALQIVIDQQQRLGISAEQSAEIVGRALQSPSEAMAALGRQGFKLEDGQKRLLKQLEATGKTAEAQSMIMDMLAEAYGGAAAAAKFKTFRGLVKGLGDQFGDFADRVAASGAFDYVQNKLRELSDYLKQMADDGRLDRLAQSLSDTFVHGAEAVEQYVKRLAAVDFESLAEKASSMAAKIGPAIEQTVSAGQYVTATLTTVWNAFAGTVNAAGAALTLTIQQTIGRLVLGLGQLAGMFGGSELKAAADGLYTYLGELSTAYAVQAKTDYGQIADAWDFLSDSVKAGAAEQTKAVKQEADDQFEHIVQRVTDINNALGQISSADTVSQLRQIGAEMYAAYQRGDLSQQDFANGTMVLQGRLKELGGAAQSTGTQVKGMAGDLKTLTDVQNAIAAAKTDRDITAIQTALKKLYDTGVIDASEYNAELKRLAAQQQAMKASTGTATTAQRDQNKAMEDAITTSEELRRASGKRMEEERRAGDAAMQQRRKEGGDAQRDMTAMGDFFGGVMTRAREPLAAMSAAALEMFDRMRGASSSIPPIDTSNLNATRQSLEQVTKALAGLQSQSGSPFTSSIGKWQLATQRASLETQQAFLSQKASLQSLMASYESGAITTRQFVSAASGAKRALGLLDDSDLSSLESAIRSAKQQMQQMEQSTRSTLEGLQDELDQLQGREDDIERRRFAARQRELQAQLAEAQAGGNTEAVANAQRALGLLRQVEAETAQQRQREEQQKLVDAQKAANEAASADAPAAPATPAPPAGPAKIIRLETSRGKTVDVGITSDSDETNLLSILEDAGLRSI